MFDTLLELGKQVSEAPGFTYQKGMVVVYPDSGSVDMIVGEDETYWHTVPMEHGLVTWLRINKSKMSFIPKLDAPLTRAILLAQIHERSSKTRSVHIEPSHEGFVCHIQKEGGVVVTYYSDSEEGALAKAYCEYPHE
jgi:hypothetical protein